MKLARTCLFVTSLCSGILSGGARLASAAEPTETRNPGFVSNLIEKGARPVTSYTLQATLDANTHTVSGKGTIRFINISDKPLYEIWVHLYLNAFKNHNSLFMRSPVSFRSATDVVRYGGIEVSQFALVSGEGRVDLMPTAEQSRPGDGDQTDMRLVLPSPIPPDGVATFEVTWVSKLPSIIARTGYEGSFHMVAQWFPKLAKLEADGTFAHFPFHTLSEFYADYGDYDVTLDVPSNYVLGATGAVASRTEQDGRTIERRTQASVHDFAWTAWPEYKSMTSSVGSTELTILYPPHERGAAEATLGAINFALPYYQARYGSYPYGTLTIAHPPTMAWEAGGMEYPTLITTGGHFYQRPIIELTALHELGHQYFYGLIATNESEWPFLDEGLTQYATADVARAMRGSRWVSRTLPLELDPFVFEAWQSRGRYRDDPIAQPARAFGTTASYFHNVYGRTASVLETVRRSFGEELSRGLSAYAQRYRWRHPTPDDFIETISEAYESPTRERVREFLRRALFLKGSVDFVATALSSKIDAPGWVLLTRRGSLSLPVALELGFAGGRTERRVWDGVAESVRMEVGPGLQYVWLDPDDAIVIEDDRRNNHASAADARRVPGRTLELLMRAAMLVAHQVAP
jgi:hypothetical protein